MSVKHLLIAVSSLALFAGCTETEPASPAGTEPQKVKICIKTGIPSLEDEDGTKVTLDGDKLVWTGGESMDILVGNSSSTSKAAGQVARLENAGDNSFSGEIELNDGFSLLDVRGLTIPADHGAWLRYNGTFRVRVPISLYQEQAEEGVLNGEYFPLYAPLTTDILDAGRQDDGSYVIDGVQLQWGCGVFKFNVYGTHPQMESDEVLEKVQLITDNNFPRNFEAKLTDNSIVRNSDATQIVTTLKTPAQVSGRTKDTGAKVYMAFFPYTTTLHEVQLTTDKGIYTYKTDYKVSGSDLRGHIVALGLNLSKFDRLDRTEYESYYSKVLSIIKRAQLPSMQVTYTEPGKTISFNCVNEDFYKNTAKIQEVCPLNIRTVYQCCSMSKNPVAYVAMKLVEAGRLDLEQPVYEYYPAMLDLFADDASKEKAKLITAKMILLHRTGLNNSAYNNITYTGTPDEKYVYSGPATHILDLALGNIIGSGLNEYARTYIFNKIGMNHSSYIYEDEMNTFYAYGHREIDGGTYGRDQYSSPGNSAYSMLSTTEEYTKYLQWIMGGADLTQASWDIIFYPYFYTTGSETSEYATAQGLIWRRDTHPELGYLWHHRGNNGKFKGWECFVPSTRQTLIFMTNGVNSHNFYLPMAKLFLGVTKDIEALRGVGAALPEEDDGSNISSITSPGRKDPVTW